MAALGITGVAVVGSAAVSVIASVPMYRGELVDHCVVWSQWLAEHPEVLLTGVPLVLMLIAAMRTGRSIRDQVRHTRRLRRYLGPVVSPPADLVALLGRLGIDDRLDVVDSPVPAVFCHQLRQPRVCVTTRLLELLDEQELAAVLLHERHHLRRRDPVRLVVARTVLECAGFIPGAKAIYDRYYTASELAADAASGELNGGRLALASAMLKLARAQSLLLSDRAAVSALSTVPARVNALLSPNPAPAPVPWFPLVKTAATLGVLVALMSAPVVLAARPEVADGHPCATELGRQGTR